MLFADEITKLELFQNALKIILVGTRNVLSPHKYFQFERTLKNGVMNSETTILNSGNTIVNSGNTIRG
jgi:hypothetical protein